MLENPANGFSSYFVYIDYTPSQYQKRCKILILECLILPVYFMVMELTVGVAVGVGGGGGDGA